MCLITFVFSCVGPERVDNSASDCFEASGVFSNTTGSFSNSKAAGVFSAATGADVSTVVSGDLNPLSV